MMQKSESDLLYERRALAAQELRPSEAEHRRLATGGPAQPGDIGEDRIAELKAEIQEIDLRIAELETAPNA